MKLLCPICQEPLASDKKTVACGKWHRFDRARQGYLNLLPVQHKKSRNPGDDKAMVLGRQAFLNEGYYQPIAETVTQSLLSHLEGSVDSLLDVGCGEGYYTVFMQEALEANGQQADWTGIDISKEAIRAATQRSRSIEWIVASAARLPIPDNSLDGMTALFSLLESAEYDRVLKANAPLVITTTGPDHLLSLRELIYDHVRPQPFAPVAKLASHFRLVSEERIRFTLDLQGESIQQLLGMTPHVWHTSPERQETLKKLSVLTTEIDVSVTIFSKEPDKG
jgi:23S rRNA (guanine745-N1)-methyltransferase